MDDEGIYAERIMKMTGKTTAEKDRLNRRPCCIAGKRRAMAKISAQKKGIAVWISWVLLVAFVMFLGVTTFQWMRDFSEKTVTNLESRVKTSEKCDLVSLELSDVVAKNSQTLNMKVTNRYNLRIDRIVFTLYDNKSDFIWLNITNTTLKPNATKIIDIPQNSSRATARIEAVPVIIDGVDQIYCTERIVVSNVTR